jgi:serralysin
MKKLVALLAGAAVALVPVLSSPAGADGEPTIADIAIAASQEGEFELLVAALVAASQNGAPELLAAASDPEASITVFAPTDAAFVALAQALGYQGSDETGALGFLVAELGMPTITNVLRYHVAGGELGATQLIRARSVDTLLGQSFGVQGVNLRDAAPTLQDPKLSVRGQIDAANGIIHPIDRVLVPALG